MDGGTSGTLVRRSGKGQEERFYILDEGGGVHEGRGLHLRAQGGA